MAPVRHFRRRKLYVYKEFQRSFVWGFCIAVFEVMLAVSLSLILMFTSAALREMQHLFPYLVALNLAIVLALLFIIYWVAMFFSHRIAGPLFRLEKLMELVGGGDLTQRVSLRKKDQLHEFAGKVNHMVEELGGKIASIQTRLDSLKARAEGEAGQEFKREIAMLEQELHELFRLEKASPASDQSDQAVGHPADGALSPAP